MLIIALWLWTAFWLFMLIRAIKYLNAFEIPSSIAFAACLIGFPWLLWWIF